VTCKINVAKLDVVLILAKKAVYDSVVCSEEEFRSAINCARSKERRTVVEAKRALYVNIDISNFDLRMVVIPRRRRCLKVSSIIGGCGILFALLLPELLSSFIGGLLAEGEGGSFIEDVLCDRWRLFPEREFPEAIRFMEDDDATRFIDTSANESFVLSTVVVAWLTLV